MSDLSPAQKAAAALEQYNQPVEGFTLRGDQSHNPLHALTPLHASDEPYTTEQLDQLTTDAAAIIDCERTRAAWSWIIPLRITSSA